MSHRAYITAVELPAPGHDWSFVPSSSDWSRLLSIVGTLTTSAATGNRAPDVIVTDETGNVITRDICSVTTIPSVASVYSWRPGNIQYGGDQIAAANCGTIPGFWLPPGASVAALTANIDSAAAVQAVARLTGNSVNLPVTVVTGTNDSFRWAGAGGLGTPKVYVVAAGTYATAATLAAALAAATTTGLSAFSLQAAVADDGSSGLVITCVADVGAAGNGDTIYSAATHDVITTITGSTENAGDIAAAGGVTGADQWSAVVATYVVADARHWLTLEAMLDQAAAGR